MGKEILMYALGVNLDHKRLSYKSFPSISSGAVTETKKLQNGKSIPGRRRRIGSYFCHKQWIACTDSDYRRGRNTEVLWLYKCYLFISYLLVFLPPF